MLLGGRWYGFWDLSERNITDKGGVETFHGGCLDVFLGRSISFRAAEEAKDAGVDCSKTYLLYTSKSPKHYIHPHTPTTTIPDNIYQITATSHIHHLESTNHAMI